MGDYGNTKIEILIVIVMMEGRMKYEIKVDRFLVRGWVSEKSIIRIQRMIMR